MDDDELKRGHESRGKEVLKGLTFLIVLLSFYFITSKQIFFMLGSCGEAGKLMYNCIYERFWLGTRDCKQTVNHSFTVTYFHMNSLLASYDWAVWFLLGRVWERCNILCFHFVQSSLYWFWICVLAYFFPSLFPEAALFDVICRKLLLA